MESPEVPLETTQEELHRRAEEAREGWGLGVALTAAILAVLAAITSLLSEHYVNHAVIEQIQSSDQWAYYQAKGVKASVLTSRVELLRALGKSPSDEELKKLKQYEANQEGISQEAKKLAQEANAHFRRHQVFTPGVTFFQIAIAVGAISVLTGRKWFWFVSIGFGVVGTGFLIAGLIA